MQVSDYITCVDCNSEGKIPTVYHTMNWCKWVWMGFALHQSNKIMSEITGQSSGPCIKHTYTSLLTTRRSQVRNLHGPNAIHLFIIMLIFQQVQENMELQILFTYLQLILFDLASLWFPLRRYIIYLLISLCY